MLKKSGKIVFLTSFTLFLVGVIIVPLVSAENVTPNTTPFITIDPIGNHTIDEVFFINGTTSLPANNELLLDIFTSNINLVAGDRRSVQTSQYKPVRMELISGLAMLQQIDG